MNSEFIAALNQIEIEKGINKDIILEAVENALVNAYKKNLNSKNSKSADRKNQNTKSVDNVRVIIDKVTGDIKVFARKEVVNKREIDLEEHEISLEGAQEIDMNYEVGDFIEEEITPKNFGRVAAQTAKQMVVQKIKEEGRNIVFEEFSLLKSEITVGEIVRVMGTGDESRIFVNLNTRSRKGQLLEYEAVLKYNDQIPNEKYRIGDRKIVYISDVKISPKSNVPEIVVSRTDVGLVKRLFEREVPEIGEGIVKIKSISREAGSRTKMAVLSVDENVDPIGSCVGPSGRRVNLIVDELKGEKIDIIEYSEDIAEYISSALSPAKVDSVKINEEEKSALVEVPQHQLSLAIGKEGQNARLAAKLTGWKIDIKSKNVEEEQ